MFPKHCQNAFTLLRLVLKGLHTVQIPHDYLLVLTTRGKHRAFRIRGNFPNPIRVALSHCLQAVARI